MRFQARFSNDVSWFCLTKMESKSTLFLSFFENVDLVKIVLPSRRELNFQGSEPQKIDNKSIPKRIRKRYGKKVAKHWILRSILAPFGGPKIG